MDAKSLESLIEKYSSDTIVKSNFNQESLLGVEKLAITFMYCPQILLRAIVHCIDGNVALKAMFYDGNIKTINKTYNYYMIHVEMKSVASIEIKRCSTIASEDEAYEYKRVHLEINYHMKDGSINTVYINKQGMIDISTNKGFKCLFEIKLPHNTDKSLRIIDGTSIKKAKQDVKSLLSKYRGYDIVPLQYAQYTLPTTLHYKVNMIAKPGDVSIENKCGKVYMNFNIFCLTFKIVFADDGFKAILSNIRGNTKQFEFANGTYSYRSDNGEYYNYSYSSIPSGTCIANQKNIFGLAVAVANYLIGQLLDPKVI